MAVVGYAKQLLGGLPTEVKRAMTQFVDYVLPNAKFGPVAHQAKSESFQGYHLLSTTPDTSNTEFSIQHGLGRTPYLIVPLLPVESSGMRTIRLYVTRPADGQRIYLSSDSTSTPFAVLAE